MAQARVARSLVTLKKCNFQSPPTELVKWGGGGSLGGVVDKLNDYQWKSKMVILMDSVVETIYECSAKLTTVTDRVIVIVDALRHIGDLQ